jgi:hypothetical protein
MSETGYTEDCCFNYTRDHCSGGSCGCRCHVEVPVAMRPECGHEAEIEQYRQRSRDEDTARIRLNHARIEAREAVALLNSMIESGESHSDQSRALVRKVLG